ncbi:MAG: hypothetical protein WC718_01755 [Phycisphaerales bacterium]
MQERGWPGAVPTLALVLVVPWADPDVPRIETMQANAVAATLGKVPPYRDQLIQELDTRAIRHEVSTPFAYLLALRTRLAFRHGSSETFFAAIRRPRIDMEYFTDGRPELVDSARRNVICLNPEPDFPPDCEGFVANMIGTHLPRADGVTHCRTVGDLLFFQSGTPGTIHALKESFAIFDSLGSDPRHLILEPDATPNVVALDRLRATTIALDTKEATIGQLLEVVSQASGVRKSPRSSPLIARERSEAMVISVPPRCDGVAFLDAVFQQADVLAKKPWTTNGSLGWTLLDGEIAVNDSEDEILFASCCIGYHDISGIIDGDGSDPLSNWEAIVKILGGTNALIDIHELYEESMSSQAIYEGAVPVPPHHIQVVTRPRAHLALSLALDRLRALGPLPLRDGTLHLPIPRKD